MASVDTYTDKRGVRGNHVFPTPYSARHAKSSSVSDSASAVGPTSAYSALIGQKLTAKASLQLIERLDARARSTKRANVALTVVGWRQSLQMITKRATQITRAVNAIRKGDITGMFRHLSDAETGNKAYSRTRTIKSKKLRGKSQEQLELQYQYRRKWSAKKAREEPGNAWLEASFGWAPLVQDIHDATAVMGSVPDVVPVVANVTSHRTMFSRDIYVDYRPSGGPYGLMFDEQFDLMVGITTARAGTTVTGFNPNTSLLTGLGLTNPAFVLWDAVPFSFVLDWFVPVGKFLNTFDAFLGYSTVNSWMTVRTAGNREYRYSYLFRGMDKPFRDYNTSNCVIVDRTVGLPPRPSIFDLRVDFQPSLWTAVTSLSLLQGSLFKLLPTRK